MKATLSLRLSRRAGLTLAEILVTIAIIGILAALAIPIFGNINSSAKEVIITDHVESLNKAVTKFSQNCWKIPTTKNDGASTDEFTVLRSLQYKFPSIQGRLGSPYFDPRYDPAASSSGGEYRIRWNGSSFELLKPGVGGTGMLYGGGGDYKSSVYSFPSDYKPAGQL